jgi:hypothetical protein
MKKICVFGLMLVIVSFLIKCKKKDLDECPACPKITSISPTHGHKGDTITLTGINFSQARITNNIVSFNGKVVDAADMISGSATELKVRVPSKCGTGPVSVKIDEELFSEPGPVFTYEVVTSMSLYAGTPGVAGTSASGTSFINAKYKSPSQLAIDNANNLYVLDEGNKKIRKLELSSGLDILLSDTNSQVNNPTCLVVDENNTLLVSSFSSTTSRIYKFTPGSTFPTIFFSDFEASRKHVSIAYEGAGKFFIARLKTNISIALYDVVHNTSKGNEPFISSGGDVVFYKNGVLYQLSSIVAQLIFDTKFSKYAVSDTTEKILIDYKNGLNMSKGLVVTDNGDIYISDTGNNRIIKYNPAAGTYSNVLINLKQPQGMAIDKQGNIYFAETGDHCIRKISFE